MLVLKVWSCRIYSRSHFFYLHWNAQTFALQLLIMTPGF